MIIWWVFARYYDLCDILLKDFLLNVHWSFVNLVVPCGSTLIFQGLGSSPVSGCQFSEAKVLTSFPFRYILKSPCVHRTIKSTDSNSFQSLKSNSFHSKSNWLSMLFPTLSMILTFAPMLISKTKPPGCSILSDPTVNVR